MSNEKKKPATKVEEKKVVNKDIENIEEVVEVTETTSQVSSKEKALMEEIEALKRQLATKDEVKQGNPDTVDIMNMVEREGGLSTYIGLRNSTIVMNRFGEVRTISYADFQELVGRCRNWFEKGIITICAGYEKVAERYALDTTASFQVDSELMRKLGYMDMTELERIYTLLPDGAKEGIISYWLRKVAEGDTNFKNARKLETLNRLSDGACSQALAEAYK